MTRVILVTDGQVGDQEVRRCDEIFGNYKFDKTICYIISTGYGNVDMSVTCPFTRNCDNKVFKKEQNSPLETIVQYTPEDYKILDDLDAITLENFDAKYDLIEGLIIALNMGKEGNIPLKNQLVVMKNRLVKEFSKLKTEDQKDISLVTRKHLQNNDFESAIQEMKTMCTAYFSDSTSSDLEKKVSHLINLCGDLRGKYNINQIKSNKMAIAKDVREAQIDKEVEVTDLSKNLIECPILNEEDVPQILIDECEPLLLGVEKNIVDDIAACPLRILNYPEIRQKLKSRLSNYVGVMGIKAHFDKDLLKNPFTQNRLLGSIPLGTHKSHVDVGNYTIARLISGGKILGNLNLYYAVIWYLIQEGSIEYLKDIEKNATEHLIFRLQNSKSYASLCGQAQFVTTELHTDVAIWFCVNSGFLNQPTDRDTFRFHYYNLEPMIKIVEALGYPNDKGLMPHYFRTKTLLNMLGSFKALKTHHEKKSFRNLLLGLYQNGIFIDGNNIHKSFTETEICTAFIPIDGPASEAQVAKIREKFTKRYPYTAQLSNEELYYLGSLIDPQKSASAYFLDYNLIVPALPKFEVSWKYGLKEEFIGDPVKLCPKTMRPYYHVAGNKTWFEAAKEKFGLEPEDLFKEYKYFEALIAKHEKFPTFEELITFYYNRFIEAGKCKTLPYLVEKFTKDALENYKPLFENRDIKEIKKIFEEYMPILHRIEAEKA